MVANAFQWRQYLCRSANRSRFVTILLSDTNESIWQIYVAIPESARGSTQFASPTHRARLAAFGRSQEEQRRRAAKAVEMVQIGLAFGPVRARGVGTIIEPHFIGCAVHEKPLHLRLAGPLCASRSRWPNASAGLCTAERVHERHKPCAVLRRLAPAKLMSAACASFSLNICLRSHSPVCIK